MRVDVVVEVVPHDGPVHVRPSGAGVAKSLCPGTALPERAGL